VVFVHTARAFVVLGTLAIAADAGGLVVISGSPRSIGRAGTGTVGDDGGGALLVNPAAMARREATRVQLGIGSVDDAIDWQSDSPGAPSSRDQSGSHVTPFGAVEGALGPWIIGVGAMTSAVGERSLRRPGDLPPEDLGNAFDYRYTGIHSFARRDTVTIGVARRIGDTVAVGASIAASRIKLAETRRMWAGFDGREQPGDPKHDVELELGGEDSLSPSAVAGVLVAPAEVPLEFAASVAWTAHTRVDGSPLAFGTDGGPSTSNTAATDSIDVTEPWTIRAGTRYVSSRFVAEANYDLWIAPASAASAIWQLNGIRVVDDPSGVSHDLDDVPSRISLRTHSAIRVSGDIELLEGVLWITTGYAYTTSSTPAARLSPTFGELAGHTVALGLEASAGGFTLTFGWSRTWWPRTQAETSDLRLDNPFVAGDTTVMPGSYGGSSDQVGIVVDAEIGSSR
jgi:hypothetical protein